MAKISTNSDETVLKYSIVWPILQDYARNTVKDIVKANNISPILFC